MSRLMVLALLVVGTGCPVAVQEASTPGVAPKPITVIADAAEVKHCKSLGQESAESTFFADRGRHEVRDRLRTFALGKGATHMRFYNYEKKVDGTKSFQKESAAYYACERPGDPASIAEGTCFFVTPTGLAITNRHVVKDALSVTITMHDGSEHEAAILRQQADADIALLQVRDAGKPAFLVPSTDAVSLGQPVFTVGFPLSTALGNDPKYAEGTISGLRGFNDDRLLQMNLIVHPGNSGGALVRFDGSLAGVVFAKADQLTFLRATGSFGEGIAFAVKSTKIAELLGKDAPAAAFQAKDRQAAIDHVIHATCRVRSRFR